MLNDDFRACIVLLIIGFTSHFIEYGRFASAAPTATTPVPYKGIVKLTTADDVYYALPATLGTPGQPLLLSIAVHQHGVVEVSAYSLPHYSRSHFSVSGSSTFISTENTSDAAQGLDDIKFEHDSSSYQVYLDVDEVARARQLFDAQPWDGWIGLDALCGILNVFEYAYDLRRRCANGNLDEDAGTMTFGTLDGPGCEGDFVPLPRFADSPCTRENFRINQVSTGGEESEPSLISVFLAERDDFYLPPVLFKPIAVAYNASKIIHGRYVVECNRAYPPVTVTVASNHTLVFDHWNLVYRKDGQCYLRVTDRSIFLGSADCGLYYTGISLFHQFCVAFDFYDANRMMVRAKKKNASDPSNICDYTPPSTTSTSMISTTSGPASGPPTGLIVGLCIAGLVVLCFLAASSFVAFTYRRKALHTNFLLAFSESRQRNKTHVALKSTNKPIEADEWIILPDELETSLVVLGYGHFSTVFTGVMKAGRPQSTGTTSTGSTVVAVKIANEGPNTASEDVWREIQRHKELRSHTHVVAMLGYVATDAKRPVLVFEYCSKGDLRKWLLESRRLSEGSSFDWTGYMQQQVSAAWQASDGMAYVSAMNIIHRDLAARNVLLTDGFVAKVADFGLARSSEDNVYPSKNFGRLPVKRMASESLKHGTFSVQSDVWAFGLLLYELFSSGEEPFDGVEPDALLAALEEGHQLELPARCPNEMHVILKTTLRYIGRLRYDVMQNCLSANPELRPTFDELRGQLATFLEKSVVQYGYLSFGAHDVQEP